MTTAEKYYFTGVQFVVDDNDPNNLVQVAIPLVAYNTKDEYLARYHQEMSYAMGSEKVKGIVINVFWVKGTILVDEWFQAGYCPDMEDIIPSE